MIIVGGTYLERTEDPSSERVFGSGLRAAAALAGTGSHRLYSCVDEGLRPSAEATASPFGLDVDFKPRELPIGFGYHSPLGPPAVDGLNQPTVSIAIDAASDMATVFGMLEAETSIEAEGIVFDPQRPRGPRPIDRGSLRARRFALVANATEICTLGRTPVVPEAARRLQSELKADVVVVKRGALGAVVFEAAGPSTLVGPHQTDRVWPIGSGDVFTAAFGWAWLEDGRPPVEAASLASACAALWCGAQKLPLGLRSGIRPEDVVAGVALEPRSEPVRVYLAGPFFDAGSRWLVGLCRHALGHLGGLVFSPFHDVGLGGDEVARLDIEGLERSETILALLDGADAGTLFELGYAAAKGIRMVGYAEHPEREDYKMLRGLGAFLTDDLSTAVYNALWAGMVRR